MAQKLRIRVCLFRMPTFYIPEKDSPDSSIQLELHESRLRPQCCQSHWRCLVQSEIHRNRRDHVDRLTVQQGRFIAPLLHRFNHRRDQQRISGDDPQTIDSPGLSNSCFHQHRPFNLSDNSESGIYRLDLPDEQGLLNRR